MFKLLFQLSLHCSYTEKFHPNSRKNCFLLRTILAVQMGAMMAGQISALTPDYVKAKVAAARLFKLFDTRPVIQSDSDEGLKPVSS